MSRNKVFTYFVVLMIRNKVFTYFVQC